MIARDESMEKAKYLLENFDRALSEEWIEVYYQPIIRAANGRVCDEAALVRWDDPIIGILNPGDFIAILEAVNVVHRLDLYVLEHVLEKMKKQEAQGLYVVPTSVNLSQIDFYSCNIVEEVTRRVDEAGISRDKIALQITETATARNNENVLSDLIKFKGLGFQVWMDDYGCGDSSPLLFQKIRFDLLKINISMVNQVKYNNTSKVIITEIIRTAMALGMETAAEGVESLGQVEFLKEIGCTKLQGYYYCKPIPMEVVFDRYRNGTQIGFENPEEANYYTAVGSVSLYDLSFMMNDYDEDNVLENYFETWPMAIVEVSEEGLAFLRGNKNFKKFVEVNFPMARKLEEISPENINKSIDAYVINAIKQCGTTGKKAIIDDRIKNGKTLQLLLQRIAVNEIKNVSAVAIAILSITENSQSTADNLTYNYIARALCEDYINLYFVDLDTGKFVEYAPDGKNRDVSVERHGGHFFERVKRYVEANVHKEDQDLFYGVISREALESNLKAHGTFSLTYRQYIDMVPTYVNMKAVKISSEGNRVIIGISNVDAQVRRQEALERIKEERITFSRISALSGDFISIYTVDPKTDKYEIYKTTEKFQSLNLEGKGEDFFAETLRDCETFIYHEDLENFRKSFSREQVMAKINETGLYVNNFRLSFGEEVSYVTLKIAMVEEMDGPQLIVGIIDVDEQVRKELEYSVTLALAEDKAYKDELTSVRNKHAYVDLEDSLNQKIKEGGDVEFAIVVFDLNGLKLVNDTYGHKAGDDFIKKGCGIICDVFSHSPVYRVGGDEFVAVAQGSDYTNMDSLLNDIAKINKANHKKGEVTIAYGQAKFSEGDGFVSDVFERADANMYACKQEMKKAGYGRIKD